MVGDQLQTRCSQHGNTERFQFYSNTQIETESSHRTDRTDLESIRVRLEQPYAQKGIEEPIHFDIKKPGLVARHFQPTEPALPAPASQRNE